MRKASRLSLAALLCLTFFGVVCAQQKKPSPTPEPTEDVVRISTELVQTDVMVFDKEGRFVSGLRPEEFELLVDDKPQQISFFESIVTGGKAEQAVLRAAGGKKQSQTLPADAGEPASDVGRTVLFFVNDLFLDPGSLARTHKAITNYIEQMLGPNDQAAITSASGQIGFLQQLTNNPVVLRAALDRLKIVPGATPDSQRPAISPYVAYVVVERNDRQLFDYLVNETMRANSMREPDRPMAAAMVEQRTKTILRQSDAALKNSMSSLVNLMHATAKLPGRKLVFVISDGFLPNFTGSDFTSMFERVTGIANRSSVVIYTIDARGLSTDSMFDASAGGGFDPSGIMQSRISGERSFMQEGLYGLAADTGGRALLNSNDLIGGIAHALDETSRYYLLAWRPENDAQRASNFSKIKVKIPGHPDLKVQLRKGYLGGLPEKAKPTTRATPVEVESNETLGVTESSSEDLHTALALGYKQTAAENMQLTSTIQVNAQSSNDSAGSVEVNVLGAVFDSRGKAVGSFKQAVVAPRTPVRATPSYATVNHQVDVAPGIYQVRVFAYERGTTKLTSTMEWIEIPKSKPGAFAISSLYVGEISQAGGSAQVTVNANRRFARSSHMRFTTYIYNAAHSSSAPQLGVQIKILRGALAVITPPEARVSTDKLTNFATVAYTGEFPLSSLPPGSYTLQVTVTDHTTNAAASQELRFSIY